MSQSTRDRCRRCKHWDSGTADPVNADEGWCHRHAPIPDALDDNGKYRRAFWPMTYASNWCGDFLASKRPARAALAEGQDK